MATVGNPGELPTDTLTVVRPRVHQVHRCRRNPPLGGGVRSSERHEAAEIIFINLTVAISVFDEAFRHFSGIEKIV